MGNLPMLLSWQCLACFTYEVFIPGLGITPSNSCHLFIRVVPFFSVLSIIEIQNLLNSSCKNKPCKPRRGFMMQWTDVYQKTNLHPNKIHPTIHLGTHLVPYRVMGLLESMSPTDGQTQGTSCQKCLCCVWNFTSSILTFYSCSNLCPVL